MRDEWNNLLHLFNISHFSSTSCGENSSLMSCTDKMAKRVQEQKGEERSVAKSKSTAMNLSSHVPASSSTAKIPIASESPGILVATAKPESRMRRNSRLDKAPSSHVKVKDVNCGGLMDDSGGKLVTTEECVVQISSFSELIKTVKFVIRFFSKIFRINSNHIGCKFPRDIFFEITDAVFFFFLNRHHHTTANASTPTLTQPAKQHIPRHTSTYYHILTQHPFPAQIQAHFIPSGTRLAQETPRQLFLLPDANMLDRQGMGFALWHWGKLELC